jgi:hypothetical protein
MIDFITLTNPVLSDIEISSLIEKNHLQTNSKDGEVYYDNIGTKNFRQDKGVFIRIETNSRLKVECSLHKYFNESAGKERNNLNLFSMSDAKKTISELMCEKNISTENLRVYNYEIGLNLDVSKDCRFYLDKMKSIGAAGDERPLYVNARYKDERVKTTVFHKHTRKFFKVYDKVYEMRDRKRRFIPESDILRIETVNRRLDNCFVANFFQQDNLKKLIESFFRDWRTVQFRQDIITPPGTGRARQDLCIQILDFGKEYVLSKSKERYKSGALKEWEYRNIREFIQKEWDTIKKQLKFVKSCEELEFRELMRVNYNILKDDGNINLQ